MVAATVVVPTFRAAETLGIAVGSALRQTVHDIEVVVVGDGVDAATREVALALTTDERVRFLDLPKDPGRGETRRDRGVREATSDAIVYLADDDILLPHHVQNMLDLLSTANFAQSRNGYIDADDVLHLLPADLGDPESVAWHLIDPPRSGVSLTGTAHSRRFYLSLERSWQSPPEGVWADLHMWRAFFAHPDFVGATHPELTTLQFPATIHGSRAELARSFVEWDEFARRSDARERMAELLDEAERRSLTRLSMAAINLDHAVQDLDRRVVEQNLELERLRVREREQTEAYEARLVAADESLVAAQSTLRTLKLRLVSVKRRASAVQNQLDELRATRSWRLTAPFRRLRSR